ncbi:hypothetical protein QFZ61_000423 [Arthrobacter sp. B3I4]|nr:hypothetical protein [Arthrobacter sp. B3I4]
MNGTPRLLNRILIGILGAKLLTVGLLLVLLATVPAAATWWQGWSAGVWSNLRSFFDSTRFPGRPESWLWIVMAVLLLAVIGAMVAWLAQQGKGRANLLAAEEDAGGTPGDVRIGGGVAEQALRAALADRPDLAGATVTTYEIKGEPAPADPGPAPPGSCPAFPGRGDIGARGGIGCRCRPAHTRADPPQLRSALPVWPRGAGPLNRRFPASICRPPG